MQTPWEKYQQDLKRDDFSVDEEQKKAVKKLQALFEQLTSVSNDKTLVAKLCAVMGLKIIIRLEVYISGAAWVVARLIWLIHFMIVCHLKTRCVATSIGLCNRCIKNSRR